MASTGAAPESLSFAAARARVLDAVSPGPTERVPLTAARIEPAVEAQRRQEAERVVSQVVLPGGLVEQAA